MSNLVKGHFLSEQSIQPRFHCEACGKSFVWKASIAGKRAKCTCGAVLDVPRSMEAEAPPDDLYELAGSAPELAKPMPTVAPAPAAATLNYHSGPTAKERAVEKRTADALLSRPRDIYVPIGMLIAGFMVVMVWAFVGVDAGLLGAIIVGIVTFAITLIKTVVLVGLAFAMASIFGANFGTFWTAVLKLAAVVVLTDATFLWIELGLENVGAIRPDGRGVRGLGLLFLLEAAIIGLQFYLLFDLDSDDLMKIGGITAVASRVIDFVVNIAVGALISAL